MKKKSLFLSIPFLVLLASCLIGETHGDCPLVTSISEPIHVSETLPAGEFAFYLEFVAPQGIEYVIPNMTAYFTMTRSARRINFWPTASLKSYFIQNPGPIFTIRDLHVYCYFDDYPTIVPELNIYIDDVSTEPPKFEGEAEATYAIELPYAGGPINWQQYLKVTDLDFLDVYTSAQFYTDRPELITLQSVERVPPNVLERLDFYKIYFGLNETWDQRGRENAKIIARGNSSPTHNDTFVVRLEIEKKCTFLTNPGQLFSIYENATVGVPALTLDVEYGKNVDSSSTPENDKYVTFDLNVDDQKLYISPRDTLQNYFDEENYERFNIQDLTLMCGVLNETAPKITIQLIDVNDWPPIYDIPEATYYVALPYVGGEDPINGDQFVKVTDADYSYRNTHTIFTMDPPDNIYFTSGSPERVPHSISSRLQYYKLNFGYNDSWTTAGIHEIVVTATNQFDDTKTSTFTAIVDIRECALMSDVSEETVILEDAPVGSVVLTLDLAGVESVDPDFDETNNNYLTYDLDTDQQKLYIRVKDTLSTYFDQESSAKFEILQLRLNCASTSYTEPSIPIRVQDVDNRAPEFVPPSAIYHLELPYAGPPINWEQFVEVRDADFLPENTNLTFTTDRDDLIFITIDPPERVPQDVTQRLEYFKLYFSLNREWVTVGTQVAMITAQDFGGNSKNFSLTLEMTDDTVMA